MPCDVVALCDGAALCDGVALGASGALAVGAADLSGSSGTMPGGPYDPPVGIGGGGSRGPSPYWRFHAREMRNASRTIATTPRSKVTIENKEGFFCGSVLTVRGPRTLFAAARKGPRDRARLVTREALSGLRRLAMSWYTRARERMGEEAASKIDWRPAVVWLARPDRARLFFRIALVTALVPIAFGVLAEVPGAALPGVLVTIASASRALYAVAFACAVIAITHRRGIGRALAYAIEKRSFFVGTELRVRRIPRWQVVTAVVRPPDRTVVAVALSTGEIYRLQVRDEEEARRAAAILAAAPRRRASDDD